MQSLFERYRPRTWDDLIGHAQVKRAVTAMKERGSLGGRAFLITGPSGIGKTSIGYLLAGDVCDPENFVELDCGDITPAKLDELEKSMRYKCLGDKPGRAVLLNECHGLRKDTVRKLLVTLERIPNHVTYVLTTTSAGQQLMLDGIDADPLVSRCVPFRLEAFRYLKDFAQRAKDIAEAEGLGGAELDDYVALARKCKANFRQMLSEIESGCLMGELVA